MKSWFLKTSIYEPLLPRQKKWFKPKSKMGMRYYDWYCKNRVTSNNYEQLNANNMEKQNSKLWHRKAEHANKQRRDCITANLSTEKSQNQMASALRSIRPQQAGTPAHSYKNPLCPNSDKATATTKNYVPLSPMQKKLTKI